jgi:signal transduction histidine kinase
MLVSVAWVFPAMFAGINRVAQARLYGQGPVSARELVWEVGDWMLYGFLTPGVFALSSRLPMTRGKLIPRGALHLVMALLFCVVWATGGKLLDAGLALIVGVDPVATNPGRRVLLDWVSWVFITLPFGVAVYFCMVGIEHAGRYLLEAREREAQVARLSEQLAGARFAALQSRMNPHFLFNTLNTIVVLMRDDDRPAAVRIVERLGDVLRTTLYSHRSQEVTLEAELKLVRQYVAIEEARFSDRLRAEFNVDNSLLSAAVPGFALQHLVENAIRHGIAKRLEAGALTISARRTGDVLELSVTDDGPGFVETHFPEGHGLENTRERLAALYGGKASLVVASKKEGGTVATLSLPYREIAEEQTNESE